MRGFPLLTAIAVLVLCLVGAPTALAQDSTGGATYVPKKHKKRATPRTVGAAAADLQLPAATIGPDGLATAPFGAPPEVFAAIDAANRIVGKPYRYGGGHAKVEDSGYDCSGTVSYALLAAKLLKSPLDSSSFMRWGLKGKGTWITVYSNPGHAFAVIAGLRLDTSTGGITSRRIARTAERGPRWRVALRNARGFTARHPLGF
jgi:hypothetical protein